MSPRLVHIPPQDAERAEAFMRPLLDRGAAKDAGTPWAWETEAVLAAIRDGSAAAFAFLDGEGEPAGLLTGVVRQEPGRRVLRLWTVGFPCPGYPMPEWLPSLKQIAAGMGCSAVQIIGRPAFARLVPAFSVVGAVMECEV